MSRFPLPLFIRISLKNKIFSCLASVPLGLERAHWRLSHDCRVMYQINSSCRRDGGTHAVRVMVLGEAQVLSVRKTQSVWELWLTVKLGMDV